MGETSYQHQKPIDTSRRPSKNQKDVGCSQLRNISQPPRFLRLRISADIQISTLIYRGHVSVVSLRLQRNLEISDAIPGFEASCMLTCAHNLVRMRLSFDPPQSNLACVA